MEESLYQSPNDVWAIFNIQRKPREADKFLLQIPRAYV